MSVAENPTTELAHGHVPMAQDATGDAASPAAIRRLSHALSDRKSPNLKAQKKAIESLKAAVAAIRVGDYAGGAKRCLQVLQADERNGLAWHVLAICREKAGHLSEARALLETPPSASPVPPSRPRRYTPMTRL